MLQCNKCSILCCLKSAAEDQRFIASAPDFEVAVSVEQTEFGSTDATSSTKNKRTKRIKFILIFCFVLVEFNSLLMTD
jgi:hypothetical protein